MARRFLQRMSMLLKVGAWVWIMLLAHRVQRMVYVFFCFFSILGLISTWQLHVYDPDHRSRNAPPNAKLDRLSALSLVREWKGHTSRGKGGARVQKVVVSQLTPAAWQQCLRMSLGYIKDRVLVELGDQRRHRWGLEGHTVAT